MPRSGSETGAPPLRHAGKPGPTYTNDTASYGDLADEPEALGALWNSDGHLELFTCSGSARQSAGLSRGSPVRAFPATG